ncbi:MAG: hypothetical protein QM581_01935 [Pseudomonas sp.]
MRLASHAPDGSIEQARAAVPRPLEMLEQLARRELASLRACQAREPGPESDREMMRALAWDLGLSGEEFLSMQG